MVEKQELIDQIREVTAEIRGLEIKRKLLIKLLSQEEGENGFSKD